MSEFPYIGFDLDASNVTFICGPAPPPPTSSRYSSCVNAPSEDGFPLYTSGP